MPVIASAKKKLRQDIKRKEKNKILENAYKTAVKKAEKSPTEKTLQSAFSLVDKAAKHYIIHKNKASRIKSRLAKALAKKPAPRISKSPKK